MVSTESSWEILINFKTCSVGAAITKSPFSFSQSLFPTNMELKPEESVYFTILRSKIIFLAPQRSILQVQTLILVLPPK